MQQQEKKKDLFGKNALIYQDADAAVTSRRTYNVAIGLTLVLGCLINALMARYLTVPICRMNIWLSLILYAVGSFGGLILLNKTESVPLSILCFLLLSVSMGLVVTRFAAAYTTASVNLVFLITLGVVALMTIASFAFPDVFLKMGSVLGFSLLGLIVVELVVSLIFRVNQVVTDYVAVFIFCGYIGYDWAVAQRRPITVVNAVRSAASIFVDIVNLFIRLLSILGKKDD